MSCDTNNKDNIYNINDLTIFLKSNNIKIINKSNKIYQIDLDYNNFIICNDNEDLFSLLDDYLKNNKVLFEISESKIILTMEIKIPSIKSKNISIDIPEIIDIFDNKDIQILKQEKLINELNKIIGLLENNPIRNNFVILPNFDSIIPIQTECLIIILYDYKYEFETGKHNHFNNFILKKIFKNVITPYVKNNTTLSNTKVIYPKYNYNFETYDFENIKYLTNIKKLIVYNYDEYSDYSIINFSNIKYLHILEELYIIKLSFKNIEFIKELKELKKLHINDNNSIDNIELLSSCEKLVELDISYCPNLKNINYLKNSKLKIRKYN
jgi:hypothetical protein